MRKIEKDKQEYVERLVHMTTAMEAHIEADAKAFEMLGKQIIEVNQDIKSLLATRSFLRGTWFVLVIVGTLIATVVPLIITWGSTIMAWLRG